MSTNPKHLALIPSDAFLVHRCVQRNLNLGPCTYLLLLKCSPAKWYLSMSNSAAKQPAFWPQQRCASRRVSSLTVFPSLSGPGEETRTHGHRMGDTHQAGAQAEDGGEVAPAVDVSAEKAVAHVAPLRAVARLRAQVHHRVRGREEVGARCQIQMETFPERVDPVVKPQAGQVIAQAPPPPPVVQLVGERFSEVIHTERGDNFVR